MLLRKAIGKILKDDDYKKWVPQKNAWHKQILGNHGIEQFNMIFQLLALQLIYPIRI